MYFVVPDDIHTSPTEGIFSNTPPLWKFQSSFTHFFKFFSPSEPPPLRKFQSLLWGDYGYFLELHIHIYYLCRWRELNSVMITWSMEQAFTWKKLKLMCRRMVTTIHFLATVGWRRMSWQKWQSRIWIHQLLLQVRLNFPSGCGGSTPYIRWGWGWGERALPIRGTFPGFRFRRGQIHLLPFLHTCSKLVTLLVISIINRLVGP